MFTHSINQTFIHENTPWMITSDSGEARFKQTGQKEQAVASEREKLGTTADLLQGAYKTSLPCGQIISNELSHSKERQESFSTKMRLKRQLENATRASRFQLRNNQISEEGIQTLHPPAQNLFRQFFNALKQHFNAKGIDVIMTPCKQNSQKKRSRGSGYIFELGVDIGLFKNGYYLKKSDLYREIGSIAKKFPQLQWGGNWLFPRRMHIGYHFSGRAL